MRTRSGAALVTLVALLGSCVAKPAAGGDELRSAHDLLWLLDLGDEAQLDVSLGSHLDALRASRVPTAEEAIAVATRHTLASGGLLAEESVSVVGLLPLGVDWPGFADTGDLVWIVRIVHQSRGLTQELWVSAPQGEVRAMVARGR